MSTRTPFWLVCAGILLAAGAATARLNHGPSLARRLRAAPRGTLPEAPRIVAHLIGSRTPNLCQANWHSAEALGLFEREGLAVERLPIARDSHGMPDITHVVSAGKVVPPDFTSADQMFHADLVEYNADYYVVAGEHSGCHQLIVPGRSPIRSVADLRGRRVRIEMGQVPLLWTAALGQAGAGFGEVRWVPLPIVIGSIELERYLREAFARGELDGANASDPVGEGLKDAGVARHLVSNTWTPPMNGWYCCMLAIRREIVDRNPDVARRIVRVLRSSAAFVEREPRRAAELAVKNGMRTSASIETTARRLKEYRWLASDDIGTDLERHFETLQRYKPSSVKLTARQLRERYFRPIQ